MDDVREELADTLIVAVDVFLTPLEHETRDVEKDVEYCYDIFIAHPPYERDLENAIIDLMSSIGTAGDMARVHKLDPVGESGALRAKTSLVVAAAFNAARLNMPDQSDLTLGEIENNLRAEVDRKLAKWKRNRDTGRAATDAE